MKLIFKYNENAKYSTKHLKGGYTDNKFLVLGIYLKPEFWNIFKDLHIVARSYNNRL